MSNNTEESVPNDGDKVKTVGVKKNSQKSKTETNDIRGQPKSGRFWKTKKEK